MRTSPSAALLGAVVLVASACGTTTAVDGPPSAASTGSEPSAAASASPVERSAAQIVLDPDECDFVGVPARMGSHVIFAHLDVLGDLALTTLSLTDPPRSAAALLGGPELPDTETIGACCHAGDLDACERARVPVDEHLVPVDRLDRVPDRDRSGLGCPRGREQASCFSTRSDFEVAGERVRLRVDRQPDVHSRMPPVLERRDRGSWVLVEPAMTEFTSERCSRVRFLGSDAWVASSGVVIVVVSVETPMMSECDPGSLFVVYDLGRNGG